MEPNPREMKMGLNEITTSTDPAFVVFCWTVLFGFGLFGCIKTALEIIRRQETIGPDFLVMLVSLAALGFGIYGLVYSDSELVRNLFNFRG